MSALVPPPTDDTVAFVTVRLHAPGTISVSGHITDRRFALQLLDHARDTIVRKFPETPAGIVIPNRDVDLPESAVPLKEFASIPIGQRGDG